MPLYNVRGALQGPATNPEAKKRNELKRLIAQFQVNPYSVTDNPRSYYTQLKAMAMQEGIPMSLPETLEKNKLGVGAYEAADTALLGLLPNQEYLSEGEKMAAGIGGAVGMFGAPYSMIGGAKLAGKMLPGVGKAISKALPKSLQNILKAKDIIPKDKGRAMKEAVNKFKKVLKKEGIDPAKFTGASGNEREVLRNFLKKNQTAKGEKGFNRFKKGFIDFLHADDAFKYKKGKGADLSGLRFDPSKAKKGSNSNNYFKMKDNPTFENNVDKLSYKPDDPNSLKGVLDWIMTYGPYNMKQSLTIAKANGDKKEIASIIQKAFGFKNWKAGGFKGSLAKSTPESIKVVATDMAENIVQKNISLLDLTGGPKFSGNPLNSQNSLLEMLSKGAEGRLTPMPRMGGLGGPRPQFPGNPIPQGGIAGAQGIPQGSPRAADFISGLSGKAVDRDAIIRAMQ